MNDAFRKLIRPEGATLEARNRAFHRILVEGVTVEYRAADGAIRGAQARAIDFDDWQANDWLAVNQFTVVENKHERRLDVALFVNGLPLAVIELKNPNDFERTAAKATPRAVRNAHRPDRGVPGASRSSEPVVHKYPPGVPYLPDREKTLRPPAIVHLRAGGDSHKLSTKLG